MNIYTKLVMASSCYFCCPAGKKSLFKTGDKEVLLHKYVCMYVYLCVQIQLYQ